MESKTQETHCSLVAWISQMAGPHFRRCYLLDFSTKRTIEANSFFQLQLATAPVILVFSPTTGPNAGPDSGPARYDFAPGYISRYSTFQTVC